MAPITDSMMNTQVSLIVGLIEAYKSDSGVEVELSAVHRLGDRRLQEVKR